MLVMVASLTFTNCSERNKAPQAVQTVMKNMYPGISKINWSNEKGDTWEAEFKNNGIKTSVTFRANGSVKEVEEEISFANFPKTALDYIEQNFPDEKIKEIAKITNANGMITYEAEIKGTDYIFDAHGNPLKTKNERAEKVESTEINTQKVESGKVDIRDLPKTVNEFVEKNYVGYKIESVKHDPMCNGDDAIDVAITKNGSVPLSLIFTPDGKFVQKEEDIDIADAPTKVKETLKVKYSDYTIGKQIEKLTLADNSVQFLIDISKAGISKEEIFDTNGNLICGN